MGNLFKQIDLVRESVPDFLQHVRDLLGLEHKAGYEEAAELWLPTFDDNDEVIGLERISDFCESLS